MNQRGQSIIQVLIASSIGLAVLLTFAGMQASMTRETRALSEKMAANDFQSYLTRIFSDGVVCSKVLTQPAALSFDATHAVAGDPAPPEVAVPGTVLPATADGSVTLAEAGKTVSPIAPTLVVAPATPFKVINLVGSVTGGVGTYVGDFVVAFDQTQLVRVLRPASTRVVLRTTASGSTQTITQCSGNVPLVQTVNTNFPFDLSAHYLDCPAGFTALGCTSITVPSGMFTCMTSSGVNPSTQRSACVQAGCNSHAPGDTSYYTSTACLKF